MPASPVELKNSFPDLELNSRRRETSARHANRHRGLLTVVLSQRNRREY